MHRTPLSMTIGAIVVLAVAIPGVASATITLPGCQDTNVVCVKHAVDPCGGPVDCVIRQVEVFVQCALSFTCQACPGDVSAYIIDPAGSVAACIRP